MKAAGHATLPKKVWFAAGFFTAMLPENAD
jgi:hypothetical protein